MTNFIRCLLVAALLFSGCGQGRLDFKVHFNQIDGLRKQDRIFLEGKQIGDVRDVIYTPAGDYLVSASVAEPFADTLTDASVFYVDLDPERIDRKALHVFQPKQAGAPLSKDAVIEGSTAYAVWLGQFGDALRKNLGRLESELNQLLAGLQNFSDSEQIKQIEKQLDRILAEIENLSETMKQKLQSEILPRIREQIEELRQRLMKQGRQTELEYVDRKVELISAKLVQ
jgi:ABC-type transporter Mla subunit MlaD